MPIDTINSYASKLSILGWFAGLAYFNWLSGNPPHVPIWGHVVLIVVGMFAASVVIGGGLALVAGGLTRAVTGRMDGSPHAYSWAAFVGTVVAFFAAKYGLLLFAA